MPRYFRARTSKEIRAFLNANGFVFKVHHGDDDVYEKQGCQYTVKIPSRGKEEIPIGTMDSIRKCIRRCGYKDKDILEFWKANGYGD